jgi:hypothetical protein
MLGTTGSERLRLGQETARKTLLAFIHHHPEASWLTISRGLSLGRGAKALKRPLSLPGCFLSYRPDIPPGPQNCAAVAHSARQHQAQAGSPNRIRLRSRALPSFRGLLRG